MNLKKKMLIVSNWKANPDSLKMAKNLFSETKKVSKKLKNSEIVVCPPEIFLESLKSARGHIVIGSQDFFYESSGAFTGFVGGAALVSTGIKYSIVGHSEKRALGDTDEIVNKKIKSAVSFGIKPILCVGEDKREAGFSYLPFIKSEIVEALKGVPKNKIKDIVIAYEPIWAVGKNATREATPKEVEEVVIFIKRILSDLYDTKGLPPVKILYGGSVSSKNASLFIEGSGIDGLLLGRSSLSPKTYKEIIESLADKK